MDRSRILTQTVVDDLGILRFGVDLVDIASVDWVDRLLSMFDGGGK